MASVFRRRKSLIFKLIILIPALWLFLVMALALQDRLTFSSDIGSDHNDKRSLFKKPNINNAKPVVNMVNIGKNNEEPLGNINEINDLVENRDREKDRDNKSDRDDTDRDLNFNPKGPEPEDPNAPGEMGRAVEIDKDKLSSEDRKKFDDGWTNNAFNQYASDMISLHRSLPDVRDEECKTLKYHKRLPDTSVVICFHNEAWSVLLRTVHSVIDRSPPSLLKEIILVDDFSDMDHLMKPLEEYMDDLGKVKVVRSKKREGLIRARLLGFSAATGDVVTFLDSHCECTEGWLEPLLDRIGQDRSHVVCPSIDNIADDTLSYFGFGVDNMSVGKFTWDLTFNWMTVPEYLKKNRTSRVAPVPLVPSFLNIMNYKV